MVGKGQKRREKNYQAAHGANNLLPPPPKLEEVEALPSKLRMIMALKNPSLLPRGPKIGKSKVDGNEKKKGGNSGEKVSAENEFSGIEKSAEDLNKNAEHDGVNKSKKKRKRREGKDLRFQELDLTAPLSKKKRRKEFLDAKKKESKKAGKPPTVPEFPGREKIKFGDVVEAPPKLSVPKVVKSSLGTYEERQRLNAERVRMETIDAYRKHKGWTSRPGMRLSAQE